MTEERPPIWEQRFAEEKVLLAMAGAVVLGTYRWLRTQWRSLKR